MDTKMHFAHLLKSLGRNLIPNIGSVIIMAGMLFAYRAQAAELRVPAGPDVSPSAISYQGTLSTVSGTPITGEIGLTFRLYSAISGGSALWTEAHTGANAVPISNGLFQVLLGSLTPIPASIWSDNDTVYLGVQVDGDSTEMTPREIVSAVPVAMQVADLTIPDGSITTAHLADGAVSGEKINLAIFQAHLTAEANLDSTGKDILSVDVDFPVDGTYLVIVTAMTALDTAEGRVILTVKDEQERQILGIHNAHNVAGNSGTDSTCDIRFFDFSAGAHTIRLRGSTTTGDTGRIRSAEIYVIPLTQSLQP